VRPGLIREPGRRGICTVGGLYREMASEDMTMDTSVCM
jgi:hypothetical protein